MRFKGMVVIKNSDLQREYEIRGAAIQDAEAIAKMHVGSWRESYKDIIDQEYLSQLDYKEKLEFFRVILKEDSSIHLVATYKGKVVGFCDAGLFRGVSKDSFQDADVKGEIYALYVLQEHQGKGIGRSLLKKVKELLSGRKLTPFIAWVLQENIKAIKFYENNKGIKVGKKQATIEGRSYLEIAYKFV